MRDSRRPLAEDESEFRRRYEARRPLYEATADAIATDADGIVLAAAGIRFAPHGDAHGDALVADAQVAELHALEATHVVPGGEAAKSPAAVERLWRALELERSSTLVALGGGSTTDVVGFAAATYLRGVDWVAVPSTLVGQVDAAIGGKVGIDLPEGKNLVGAFHWPASTVIDTALLETLPEEELRNGRAEVVKTGLLAGEPLWELARAEQVRRCAAFKAAVCLRDPLDRGDRVQLNLGHTFAHALEAGSGLRGSARTRGRPRPSRRASPLGSRRGDADRGEPARAGAGRSRPRARLGRSAARQEDERRADHARPARAAGRGRS